VAFTFAFLVLQSRSEERGFRPNDFEVITENPVDLAGITSLGYLVVVSGEDEDYFLRPSEDGAFSAEVELIEGANQIIVWAFDEGGNSVEKRLTLALSTEFAKVVSSPTPTSEDSQEATDSVREKVQEKVSAARSSPKFVMGSITDKQENTLEVKTQSGEIAQVSASDELTTIIKIDKTKREVKYTDVAIGDFILAMGFQNGNGVLDARRVLISQPLEPTTRRVILGKITDVQKTQIGVESLNGQENLTFSDNKNLSVYLESEGEIEEIDFADLEAEQKVAVIGDTQEEKFVARSILVLPQ